ncbi:hypothetical protein JCM24511_02119 [Saitozyma sp. JCM 24511]|nr:hypothetical protein JCM24511_02119 [Saitozyma sp. JCM 24511]
MLCTGTVLVSYTVVIFLSQSLGYSFFSFCKLAHRDALLAASKLIGGCHALIVGGFALNEVLRKRWTRSDLIRTQSQWADAVVALEAGYLIGDTVFLVLHRRTLRKPAFLRRVIAHHAIVFALLITYLRAAARGKASGAFFVASFMIMNLSTPLQYLVWAVQRFGRNPSPAVVTSLHVLAMTVYAVARFGLLYYQLWIYGQTRGLSVIKAFNTLPPVCRTGILILLLANGTRFVQISATRHKTIE